MQIPDYVADRWPARGIPATVVWCTVVLPPIDTQPAKHPRRRVWRVDTSWTHPIPVVPVCTVQGLLPFWLYAADDLMIPQLDVSVCDTHNNDG